MVNTVSRIGRMLADKCSGFPQYFTNVQGSNCQGCPKCRCVEGPSAEEARKDYVAMLRAGNSAYIGLI